MPNQQMQLSVKHTGETQKMKEFNPVFYLWVPSRHSGMDMSSVHKPAQQMTGWGWGDVVKFPEFVTHFLPYPIY